MRNDTQLRPGLRFFLPDIGLEKAISIVEVGPFIETGLAAELNKFFGVDIESLLRINTYLLVHSPDVPVYGEGSIESLLTGKPFVDPVLHQATLNESLALKLSLPFDYVMQSMLNPGTSDSAGNIAFGQTMIALGELMSEGDKGFYSRQYFLKGLLSTDELASVADALSDPSLVERRLEEVSQFLANPDLNTRRIITRQVYENGVVEKAPIVSLKPEIKVQKYDLLAMGDEELLALNAERKLAANLEELHQLRDMFTNEEYVTLRKVQGLDHRITDVELELWFGLRSEHCFHKEFNAKITLEDLTDDGFFARAAEKGWLKKDGNVYTLEDGIFKTFVEQPAVKIFNNLEKRGKNWIASMFKDNSGVVYYDQDYMFCIKFETHNSPSNKEPVQGAKTGIDGVNRDIFGTMLGTFDLIANFFYYCTGDSNYQGWLPKGVKHPYVILKGITQGVREGGNESQIATLNGGIITDPRYIAKCLVYCGTVGFSPVNSADGMLSYTKKHASVGDIVYIAGQPVGVDGIHGATESSLSASAFISLGHVQADDSYVQVRMKELILDAARAGIFSSITDCGAMGMSSAYELSRETGGCIIDLAKHPSKYVGIQPWQITTSETQDRMVVVTKPVDEEELMRRAELFDSNVTNIGELTDLGYIHLTYEKETVALINIQDLFNQKPRKKMHATWHEREERPDIEKKVASQSLEDTLCQVISQPDVASKEWFFKQKDSSVKGATIISPLIGYNQEVEADATMQKPLETEGHDFGAIAYAHGINPKQSDIDPYNATQNSFLNMVGKIVALGVALPDMDIASWDAWAVCGNYCQPNSEGQTTLTKDSGEYNLASLVREGIGVREVIEKLNIPIISGKDSMKCSCVYDVGDDFTLENVPADLREHINLVINEETGKKKIEIHDPDTYLVSGAVKVQDYRKCVTSEFKSTGDYIYVLGTTRNETGGTQLASARGYNQQDRPYTHGEVPTADLDEFVQVADAVHEVVDADLVKSCKAVHDGGIGVAIAKSIMAVDDGKIGVNIDVNKLEEACNGMFGVIYGAEDEMLYSETPGRYVISIDPMHQSEFEKILEEKGVTFAKIGKTTYIDSGEPKLNVLKLNDTVETIDMSNVKGSYQSTLSFGLQEQKQNIIQNTQQ